MDVVDNDCGDCGCVTAAAVNFAAKILNAVASHVSLKGWSFRCLFVDENFVVL